MYILKFDSKVIKHIEEAKPSAIILSPAVEYDDILGQMPYYVKSIAYAGANDSVINCLALQYNVKGIHFTRPKYSVDLVITSKCNLSCSNCNILSNYKSTWNTMELADINSFIAANIGKDLTVKVTGGEPLLSDLLIPTVQSLLQAEFKVVVLTNGILEMPKELIDIVAIENSSKQKGVLPMFHSLMVAPCDLPEFDNVDYSQGCSYATNCGYSYKDGKYYGCTVAKGLYDLLTAEGIVNQPITYSSLEDAEANRSKTFHSLCRYCGLFKKAGYHSIDKSLYSRTDAQELSDTWKFMEGIK